MTTLFKIDTRLESKNALDLVRKGNSTKKVNLNTKKPKRLQSVIQVILIISLSILISSCNSNNSSEDSLVSELIKELNSQRNISIYDDVEKIVFNSENNKGEPAFKATSEMDSLEIDRDASFDPSESLDSKNDSSDNNKSNSKVESKEKSNGQYLSHTPFIVAPLIITLEVGAPLNLAYHVYDIDSDYVLTWVDGWVKSADYVTKSGDEGVHSITVYASDYESTVERNVTINVIRKNQLSNVEIFHILT